MIFICVLIFDISTVELKVGLRVAACLVAAVREKLGRE